jgi:hypothetical protein
MIPGAVTFVMSDGSAVREARSAPARAALGHCPISGRKPPQHPFRYSVAVHRGVTVIRDTDSGKAFAPKRPPVGRGIVKGMSEKSRMRLLRTLARIERPEVPVFITLTYQTWEDDWKAWKRDLAAFRRVLFRRCPHAAGVWRQEFQERGAPHWHLLLWLGQEFDVSELEQELTEAWVRIIGQDNAATRKYAVSVEAVPDIRTCKFYISLYQAKDKNDRKDIQTGREWGLWRPHFLGMQPLAEHGITKHEFLLLRRAQRGLYRSFKRKDAKRSHFFRGLKRQQPFTAFTPVHVMERMLSWAKSLSEATLDAAFAAVSGAHEERISPFRANAGPASRAPSLAVPA